MGLGQKVLTGVCALSSVCALAKKDGTPLFSSNQSAHDKVIYGDDNRRDLYEAQNPAFAAYADSTVALFKSFDIEVNGDTATLSTSNFGESMGACREEPYFDQPNGAFCSGSLVAPDIIMTAGHCVVGLEACQSTRFVFGFSVRAPGQYPTSVPASEVYGCKELITRKQESVGYDYALVRLDRPVTNHTPLQVNRSTTPIANGTSLVVIGHPSGLPTKISDGATVRNNAPAGFFVANLDTYGGNSGSAVINTQTGLVEGILVRGETDYTWQNGCRVSYRCTNEGCRGEDVTKLNELLPYLQH